MLPFLVSRWMWQTDRRIDPSLIAYVLSVTEFLAHADCHPSRESRSEWEIRLRLDAAAIFALNPSDYFADDGYDEPV